MPPSRVKALLLAVLVVIIWSTSWIMLKYGVQGIPTLTLNGLRYTLAFLVMVPFLFLPGMRKQFTSLSRNDWKDLLLLGIVFIALAQGTLALSLVFLPATTASLIVNCTPVFVAFFGIGFLGERPRTLQWAGVGVNMLGILLYFFPVQRQDNNITGLVIAFACLLFNTAGALLSRRINRGARMNAFLVSLISLGVGGILMLLAGLAIYGLPVIRASGSGLLIWLAVVNTAVAFPLWNYSLQTLTAMESNIISNTMLIYVAILAYLILGESLTGQQVLGLVLTAVGAVMVQIQGRTPALLGDTA
ncbi:MAG: EamA family transporter [Anaerolineaceae bacterium]|nr:EamA family transporter [Anaerolineaceae bacterium]